MKKKKRMFQTRAAQDCAHVGHYTNTLPESKKRQQW